MQQRRACRLAAGLVVLVLMTESAAADAVSTFPDMSKSWYGYQDAVSFLMMKGSINGYPDGTFRPTDTVNRAEFLKLVFRSRGPAEPVTGDCFADVKQDAWYAPFVCAAKRRRIVSGYKVGSRTLFRPDQPILFAEAVKMTLLAYGNNVAEGHDENWYKPYVEELDRLEVLPSWSYNPGDPIVRERAADLIARYVRYDEQRAIANLSSGCGKAEGNPSLTLTVNGQDRSYLLTKARHPDPARPSPLIVAFHGRTNSNEQVRAYFGLDRAASDFFIAYPAAVSNGNGGFSWSDPGDRPSAIRDVSFFDAIVKELSNNFCIDMDRIFVVGHSLGAWMANSVACARGGIVRGSATIGGSTTMNNCSGPSAALIINNPKDSLSPHASAEAMRDIRLAKNTCGQDTEPVDSSALSCVTYAGCTDNPVTFCPHTIDTDHRGVYYPHVWPRGTAEEIVRFFRDL